jgi:hypothetical protein
LHKSQANGHLVWKEQPGGTLTGLGISPVDVTFFGFKASSAFVTTGIDDNNI